MSKSKNNLQQQQKIKRILIYYQELSRMHVSHEGAMKLMVYIFHVSERWLLEILRDNSIEDFRDVKLEHLDLDMKLIDAYLQKVYRQGKSNRKQLKLF